MWQRQIDALVEDVSSERKGEVEIAEGLKTYHVKIAASPESAIIQLNASVEVSGPAATM